MTHWNEEYKTVYKDYFIATLMGVLVLLIYKFMVHFLFINQWVFFGDYFQDTNALKNLKRHSVYYILMAIFVLLLPLLVYIFDKVGLGDKTVKPWFIYSNDRNLCPKIIFFIKRFSSVTFNLSYGIMFCFLSDAIENPTILLQCLVLVTSIISILTIIIKSVAARIYYVKVVKFRCRKQSTDI